MKKPIKINLGCGITVVKDFINVDKMFTEKQLREKKGGLRDTVFEKGAKYVRGDILALPFKDNYADYIETIDAVEHISFLRILTAFKEMYRVLKPGGKLVVVTPNFDQLAELWTNTVKGLPLDNQESFEKFKNVMEVIYGNQLHEGEYHKTPFNPQFLLLLLTNSGFKIKKIKIIIYPMGNSDIRKKIKTQKWEKGLSVRTEMLLAEAIK